MKNILVTGGAGYIGSHTVVALAGAGFNPVIIDNYSNSEKSVLPALEDLAGRKIAAYEGDYQDTQLLSKVIDQEQVDGVIHFAAYKAVGESVEKPLQYYGNNVAGLVTLLEQLEQHSIAPIVFSSSCTVYGEADHLPVTEDAPLKPAVSPYGATKQMCEQILHDAAKASISLKAIALRYFNPIGAHPSGLIGELPRGIPNNLVPFVAQAAAGLRERLTVFGNDYDTPDGSCIRDYIHVMDLAEAHVKALAHLDQQPATYHDVFNVGTGQGHSVLEVIETFQRVTAQKVPYHIGPRRAGDIVKIYAAGDKAKQVLDWQARRSLEEALADAWRWQTALTASKEA